MSLVLVVDDEVSLGALICDWLASEGIDSVCVGSAGEALAWFENAEVWPQVALVDIKLPDWTGFDLADELESRFGFDQVIFVSAFIWEEETLRQLKRRGKPFFEKPLKFKEEVMPFLRNFLGLESAP